MTSSSSAALSPTCEEGVHHCEEGVNHCALLVLLRGALADLRRRRAREAGHVRVRRAGRRPRRLEAALAAVVAPPVGWKW